jgi:hypothetical protein
MTPNKMYVMYATTIDFVTDNIMSNAPSMIEHNAKVASPNTCQLKRNQPSPKDAAAPVKSKTHTHKVGH